MIPLALSWDKIASASTSSAPGIEDAVERLISFILLSARKRSVSRSRARR